MFREFFSYFWPIIKHIPSDYNGPLKLTLYNGQKTLDSRQTNYSYGLLQQVFESGLSQVQFNAQEETLLLGMGAGSVLVSLREKFGYQKKITAVEYDKKIIAIAQEEFDIAQYSPLEIVHKDAAEFVESATNQYGLILIDLFIDMNVRVKFYQIQFWQQLLPHLSANGIILFNSGFTPESKKQLTEFKQQWKSELTIEEICFPDIPNRLLAISKNRNEN